MNNRITTIGNRDTVKSFSEMTFDELLFLRDHGIIEAEAVNNEIMIRKAAEFQEKYHYWKTSKGIYKVHVYDGKKRKVVERKTEIDMIRYLQDREDGKIRSMVTFRHCYEQWRRQHDQLVDSNTVQKYESDYRRYFENSELLDKPVSEITKDHLMEFMVNIIRHPTFRGEKADYCLNRRATKALWGYITNTFEWAVEHGYIEEENNPCSRIIPAKTIYRLTEEQERADDRIVIPPEQLIALNAQFRKDYEKQPGYMPVYALELAALTGMRAGEIVALKWDDIHGRYIEVRRRESVDKITGAIRIKPIPKNKKPRPVPYTDAIRDLLTRVKEVQEANGWLGEYIFTGADGRVTVHQLSSCMKNKCNQIGITPKGINAYRRTVNSLIRANGLSAEAASAVIGNTPAVNNQYYTFDVTEDSKKYDVLDQVNQFMLNPGGSPGRSR